MTIRDLKIGQKGRIESVGGEGALRQHFLDMGVIPGEVVTLVKLAPLGDPMELRIQGYELTLRVADADRITVSATAAETAAEPQPRPAAGEGAGMAPGRGKAPAALSAASCPGAL